ncbi:unnamed protein product [Kuraishia capsulata CBS 1993]|uniref:RNA exonuclease 4 n=1 Tax=Kuraishia capsulata CBS 1993 TaxID=1382522 RepID=W6MQ89_9ASCO|nr:uncharacterized protein KUCA_T00004889001 [Kuraishia capsulata CBS 1993]CDK28904.1 unnamed protein product [Kuraishia capsulata CBS 1993]
MELSSNWSSFQQQNGISRPSSGQSNPNSKRNRYRNRNKVKETASKSPHVPVVDIDHTKLGKYVAMDCEFVGCGPKGSISMLGRVSIVNYHGHVVLDTFVKPPVRVTDWRTWISGVSPRNMAHAVTFKEAQAMVLEILEGRVLVGHAVQNDLKVLEIQLDRDHIRDTTNYPPFKHAANTKVPGLRTLAKVVLGKDIQKGQHSSVEDAQITMELFRLELAGWECEVSSEEED